MQILKTTTYLMNENTYKMHTTKVFTRQIGPLVHSEAASHEIFNYSLDHV